MQRIIESVMPKIRKRVCRLNESLNAGVNAGRNAGGVAALSLVCSLMLITFAPGTLWAAADQKAPPQAEIKTEPKAEIKTDPKTDIKPDSKSEPKTTITTDSKKDAPKDSQPDAAKSTKNPAPATAPATGSTAAPANVPATAPAKTAKAPETLTLSGAFSINELELKGDFVIKIISTEPLAVEVRAKNAEFDSEKTLDALDKLGFIDKKKTNLPFKGKVSLENFYLKKETGLMTMSVGRVKLPPFFKMQPVFASNVNVTVKDDSIGWQVGEFALEKSGFKNLSGAFEKAGKLTAAVERISLDLAAVKNIAPAFVPDFNKTVMDALKFARPTDYSLSGMVTVTGAAVTMVKKEDVFKVDKAQARVKLEPEAVLRLTAAASAGKDARAAPAEISLRSADVVVTMEGDAVNVSTEGLSAAVRNLNYFKESTGKTPGGEVSGSEVLAVVNYAEVALNKLTILLAGKDVSAEFDLVGKPSDMLVAGKKFAVQKLLAHVAKKGDITAISNTAVEVKVDQDGFIKASGSLTLPFDMKTFQLDLSAKNVKYDDFILNYLEMKKDAPDTAKIKYDVFAGGMGFKGETRIMQKDKEITAVTPLLSIIPPVDKGDKTAAISPAAAKKPETPPKPFDFSFTSTLEKFVPRLHMDFDRIEYGDKFAFENTKLIAEFAAAQSHLSFLTHTCGASFAMDCGLTKDALSCSTELKGVSVPFEHLAGCFISESELVYITGKTNFQFTGGTFGKDTAQCMNNLKLDGSLNIENGKIFKLSNITGSMSFIVDILSIVGLTPSGIKDVLPFEKFVGRIQGGTREIRFKDVYFNAPGVMRASAQAVLKLEPKKEFSIKGEAEKGIFKKTFDINKNLEDKK
jgi:hypothetical protein